MAKSSRPPSHKAELIDCGLLMSFKLLKLAW